MRGKRFLTAICLASGLLVAPVRPAPETLGLGTDSALAKECAIEVKFCQEFNFGVYKTEVCYTFRFFCD